MMRTIIVLAACVGAVGCTVENAGVPDVTGPSVFLRPIPPPTPDFTFEPKSPTIDSTVAFDASATKFAADGDPKCKDACTYTWDFGGGTTASGEVATHRFPTVGTHPVKLTVSRADGSTASATKNVTVEQGTLPTASMTVSPTKPAVFETAYFTAEASKVGQPGRTITKYEWTFGDGATASGVTVTHSYNAEGAYTVVLKVTDSAGLQATSTQSVDVTSGITTVDFTISPSAATLNQTVVLNAESSKGRNPIVKYFWNFGKDTSVTETTSAITSTSYDTAGTYTITLTVEDSAGRRATAAPKTIKVE